MNLAGSESGKVEWFDDKLGAGFVRTQGGDLVYVHYKDIAKSGHRKLQRDEEVSFTKRPTAQGLRLSKIQTDKPFSPKKFAKSRIAKRFIDWAHRRRAVRYIWVVRNDQLVVNIVRYYILKLPFMEVYLHQFFESDDDVLHNHPWSFLTLFLAGGYTEEFTRGHKRVLSAWRLVYRKASFRHRVLIAEGNRGKTWTLVMTGSRGKVWSFFDRYSGEEMTPEEYAIRRKYTLKTNDDFEMTGVIFPKLKDGTSVPTLVLIEESN